MGAIDAWSRLPPGEQLRLLAARDAELSLSQFVQQAFALVNPTRRLVWGWPLEAVCEHLEAIASGQIRRLAINIPPRTLKSFTVSVCFPCWLWIRRPETQYICVSGVEKVMLRDALTMKTMVQSDWYRRAFRPNWDIRSAGQDAKGYFRNSRGGHRISQTSGSSVTGNDADGIVVDDLHDVDKVAKRGRAVLDADVEYFDGSLKRRLNDPDLGWIVVIMQRVHECDLSGELSSRDGWNHLILPAEWGGKHRSRTVVDFRDPRTEKGELLMPGRLTREVLAEALEDLGAAGYASQYLQDPIPDGGIVFVREQFRVWEAGQNGLPAGDPLDYVFASWDLNNAKDGAVNRHTDPVCGQVWGVRGENCYLIEEYHAQVGLTDSYQAIRDMIRRRPTLTRVLIETKANGKTVATMLQHEFGELIEGVYVQGESKPQRAKAVQPLVESGKVHLPPGCGWVWTDWIPEVCGFPSRRHDDRVDAMTQALAYVIANPPSQAWVM